MTVVNLDALETLLEAPGPISSGGVRAEYWAGSGPFVNVAGAEVIFPAPIDVAIVDGAPAATLDLPETETEGVCCVRWTVAPESGRPLRRFTSIESIAIAALQDRF